MILLIALLLTVGVVLMTYLVRPLLTTLRWRKEGKIKMKGIGLEPHWLLGSLHLVQVTEESFNFMESLLPLYPKIGQLWMGPFVWYLTLTHPHVLKPILATAEPKDELGYGFLRPWIGDGLLVSKGKKWHRNRHLLTRAFHFDILRGYTEIFNSCATTMLDKWVTMPQSAPVEMFKHVSLMTLDNMLLCTMSCTTNCQTDSKENRYIKAVFDLGEIVMNRMFNPLIHNDFVFYLTPMGRRFKGHCEYVHAFDEKIIQERKVLIKSSLESLTNDSKMHGEDSGNVELYKKATGKNLDFLDILLLTKDEDGKGLSDREIRDEVDTFLFEGHDTTASGISWAFYCLATYPDYQEKCREEVRRVLGDKEFISWDDVAKLSYLTMFIKEVLRLHPPVFTIARKLSRPLTFPRGFGKDQTCFDKQAPTGSSQTFNVGTALNIPIYMLHRNPTVWENPKVFKPLRFSAENSKDRSAHAYLPFSAGPRNCIGKNFAITEMKVTLCKALQRFRFYIDRECPKPEIHPTVVLKARHGIFVKMDPL
ncbi:cytochrome P450 4F4-like [Clavelina lepadiformis]|uniref:cytochrome P450 4F4-like n=1 Tax=Clavelina lepadiformis TaxID=159417 RepID=UPI004042BA97